MMVAQDEDAHGVAVDAKQEVIREAAEICAPKLAGDRMEARGIFHGQRDVRHEDPRSAYTEHIRPAIADRIHY